MTSSDAALDDFKLQLIIEIDEKAKDRIIEHSNAVLLKKLIRNADSFTEALSISELGTVYRKTGIYFNKRLERCDSYIKPLKRNDKLSFRSDNSSLVHKLIIGDNYEALLSLMTQYKGAVDVIYIDPPYGKDSKGEFSRMNYDNSLSRDNLLSMLYSRLVLAKQLLAKDGVIFISIDDKNQAYVKCLMDEIFGERLFLLNVPRLTKKGGKSTKKIAKNNDYIIGYALSADIKFSQEEKTDIAKYKYEDEYVSTRGKYALTQTLDYNSLQYNKAMDYEIEMEGKLFYPGGSKEKMIERHNGNHGVTDWVWRWSQSAVEWGKKEGLFVIKNNRIYTKSYLNCRKKNGKKELEEITATKAYTTLSYVDNKYSNDNGKRELDRIFDNGHILFKNPKPTALVAELIKMVCLKKNAVILDFFAGSGTTGQAVLELNKDGGQRKFILCTDNEITDAAPNGMATDVTAKRLKRVMTGTCYDGSTDFDLARKSFIPYGGNLDVFEFETGK